MFKYLVKQYGEVESYSFTKGKNHPVCVVRYKNGYLSAFLIEKKISERVPVDGATLLHGGFYSDTKEVPATGHKYPNAKALINEIKSLGGVYVK